MKQIITLRPEQGNLNIQLDLKVRLNYILKCNSVTIHVLILLITKKKKKKKK